MHVTRFSHFFNRACKLCLHCFSIKPKNWCFLNQRVQLGFLKNYKAKQQALVEKLLIVYRSCVWNPLAIFHICLSLTLGLALLFLLCFSPFLELSPPFPLSFSPYAELALPFFHLDQAFGFMEAVLLGIDFMHNFLIQFISSHVLLQLLHNMLILGIGDLLNKCFEKFILCTIGIWFCGVLVGKVFTKALPGHGCPSLKVFLVITSWFVFLWHTFVPP